MAETEQLTPEQIAEQEEALQLQAEKTKAHRARAQRTLITQLVVGLLTVAAFGWVGIMVLGGFTKFASDYNPSQGTYNYQSNYNPPAPTWNPFPWIHFRGGHHIDWDSLGKILQPLTALSVIGGIGLYMYARSAKRQYLELDRIGLLVSDSSRGEGNARFIPWACLEAVEVGYLNPKTANLADEAAILEANANDPDTCQVVFYVDDGSIVKIKWPDLISCVEPGTFINALKTYAPEASALAKFPGEVGKVDTSTYTKLWFKYYSTSSERKRTTQLAQGEMLQEGRFEVAGQLGGGGQGTAYLVVDNEAKEPQPKDVVLKEYILPVHRGEVVLEQTIHKLKQEADILRRIDHPNIVKMLGEFIEDHRGYLIMEYVQGNSLKALVAQNGPMPEDTVRQIGLQICEVLAYLHGLTPPVVHRDLTPDNLILQADGIVKLVDFNVAHQLESAATATVVGKHCYIPPEQFRGKPTPQSDIYAFGCTLHYILTGQEPEPLTVSRPREKNEHVSEEMDEVVARCTMLESTKRYHNIQEVYAVLQHLQTGAKIQLNNNKITA